MADIQVIASFKVNNPAPADAKYLVADAAALTALLTSGNAYVGMQVYNQADDKLYIVYNSAGEGEDQVLAAKELLGSTASEISDLQDTVDKLDGADTVEGSVKKQIKDAVDALEADKTSDDEALVTVQVVEEDGVITDVVVADTDKATTLRTDITTLQGLHATKTVEGAIVFQSVADEVNAGITALVNGAPAALDTLKEIADWIANQDENGVTDATELVARVDANTTAIGTKAVAAAEGVEAKAATGLYKYVDDAVSAANSAAEDAIEALDVTDLASTGGTNVTVTLNQVDGKVTSLVVAENDIASAELLGTAADAAGDDTAFAKIAKAQAAADAAKINTVTFATSDADVTGTFSDNTLTLNNVASATDLGTAEGKITVLEGLHAVEGEAFKTVAQEISAAINALDTAEGGVKSANTVAGTAAVEAQGETAAQPAVASTQHVQVTVTEENGLINSVSVTEADIASKVVLDEEIARAKAAEKKLSEDIGTAKAGENAGTGLTGRIEALEAKAGTKSVATQIAEKIESMDNADGTTSTGGDRVTVKITEADGMISGITVTENDIAQASVVSALDTKVGNIPEGATATTVVAYAKEVADAAQGEADGRLTKLEATHAKDGDAYKTVKAEAEGAIAAIAEASKDNGTGDLVKVTVKTAAGSVSSVAVDDSALDTLLGSIPADATATTIIGYVDEKVAEVNSAVEDLDKDLTGDKAISSTDGKVTVGIKQEDGLITSLTVATDDIASADALSDLVGLVGAAEKEDGDSSIIARLDVLEGSKTTEGSVAYQIAQVVADAPQAFDTLKEIADWIGTGDVANTTAASMLSDISALKTQVGTEATTGENAQAATGLVKDIRALEAKVGTTDVSAQITAAIEDLDATVGSTTVASGKHVAVQVVETDGELTSLTVTEDDIASAAALGKLVTLVGAAEKANASDDDILTRVGALETAVGDDSVADQIAAVTGTPDADKTLQDEIDAVEDRLDTLEGEATVAGSVAEAKKAADDAQADADAALITTVTFAEGTAKAGAFANNTLTLTDIASETALNALKTTVGTASVKEGETVTTAATGLVARIESLEELKPCTASDIADLFANAPIAE